MRLRSARLRLLLVCALLGAGALAAGVLLATRRASTSLARSAEEPEAPAAESGAASELESARGVAADSVSAPPASGSHDRHPGFLPPAPDALAAVRGRVLDARTGAALPGFTLTFLSRRPRTVRATTDALGFFATPAELATGVVALQHVADGEKPLYAARWSLDLDEFLLPVARAGAPPFEITLRARSPESVLEVDVVLPDGRPAESAAVALTGGLRDAHGEIDAETRAFEVADARGRARFALTGPDALRRSYRLEADRDGTLVSELCEIDPPLGTWPRRIDLAPGGTIRVHVGNDGGRPLAGVSLWLSTNEGGRFVSGRQAQTDARGDALFGALRAGCWTVTALHPLTGRAATRPLDLVRGGHLEADFTFTLAGLRLALSGVVLDELGDPLPAVGVHLCVTGEESVQLETDDHGRFELWARPAEGVLVGVGTGFGDDLFEPEFLALPFGTTGYEVRRRARVEAQTRTFVLADAGTRERVVNAVLVLHHPARNALEPEVMRIPAPAGFAQSTFKCREGLRYAVDAPGYKRVEGSLAELVQACGPNPAPLCLELQPGFERRVQVRDRATRHAISGAVLEAGGRVLGTSDAVGDAVLECAAWPAAVRVHCAGYEPLAWDPLAAAWPGTAIWLEPRR